MNSGKSGAVATCSNTLAAVAIFPPECFALSCCTASRISAFVRNLICALHAGVEDFFCDLNQPRMCYPRTIVPGPHLAQLVLPNLLERLLVRRPIILDWNLRGHSTHGVNPSPMAGLYEQLNIGFQ